MRRREGYIVFLAPVRVRVWIRSGPGPDPVGSGSGQVRGGSDPGPGPGPGLGSGSGCGPGPGPGPTKTSWMLWSPYVHGTRPDICFGHGLSDHGMFLEHERIYALGMDALVSVCS